jgi:hypothetical protein
MVFFKTDLSECQSYMFSIFYLCLLSLLQCCLNSMCMVLNLGSYCLVIFPYDRSSLSPWSLKRIMHSPFKRRELLYKWMCMDPNYDEWVAGSTVMQTLSNQRSVFHSKRAKHWHWHYSKGCYDIYKLVHNTETWNYSHLPLKSCSKNK